MTFDVNFKVTYVHIFTFSNSISKTAVGYGEKKFCFSAPVRLLTKRSMMPVYFKWPSKNILLWERWNGILIIQITRKTHNSVVHMTTLGPQGSNTEPSWSSCFCICFEFWILDFLRLFARTSLRHSGKIDTEWTVSDYQWFNCYLIFSESSMFVTERRFILKTCGTTTLLFAIQPLLQLVKEECGFDTVAVSSEDELIVVPFVRGILLFRNRKWLQ